MSKEQKLRNVRLFGKIRLLSNECRFKIVELVEKEPASVTALSKKLGLSYTKCDDYVRLLEKSGLVNKKRAGRVVIVSSKVRMKENAISFL